MYDKATFYDFDQYQETAYKWQLDFRLMSKGGFNSTRTSLITDKVIINLSQINGQIVQYDLCPSGFRTFVVPVADCKDFYWLKRNITQNQIMAFPSNRTLDAISFDGFQVYTISISNSYLESLLNRLEFDNASKLLSDDEVAINVRTFYEVLSAQCQFIVK